MINALIGHLVGDFILQNDWMAANKKKQTWPCLVHCAIWTACVCLFAGITALWAIGVLFGTHFLQDRTQIIPWSMRRLGQTDFATGKLSPWSIIVVDNTWHLLTIWIMLQCLS